VDAISILRGFKMNKVKIAIGVVGLMILGATLQGQSGGQQIASLEQALNAQYPKGTMLNLLTAGVFGTVGCATHPASTFKVSEGKLHAPGFGQNLALATLKCATQPIAPGTQVYLAEAKVYPKNNKVAFAVVQGDVASQVDFEFPKGFLATAQLGQVQEAVSHVFSMASTPDAPGREATVAPTVSEATPPPFAAPLQLPSSYVSSQNPADQLQLNADNTFSLQEGGQNYRGTFAANGNTLELNISDGPTTTVTIQGNNLTDSSGQTWVLREQTPPAASGAGVLQNQDIIKMVKAGLDETIILAKIGGSKCQFDTSTDALIQLKESGVSAAVLKAMVGAGR
jgi:hypothetical protein